MAHNLKSNNIMNAEKLNQIVEQYDRDRIQISDAYTDGGPGSPWKRFHRAATNQVTGGDATLGRYAIWANTVRDNAHMAHSFIEAGRPEEALPALVYVINSLSAFSDVQHQMDPYATPPD